MLQHNIHPASYRDPSGFVFMSDGVVYRQVNSVYANDYDLLMNGPLYNELIEKKWLIEHEVVPSPSVEGIYKIIKPRQLDLINYPYEWCFSQLKHAALLTLNIQQLSMKHGMSLKDATAFNIVFDGASPLFIDSLSFEKYDSSSPWVAYRQFCENFLAPLLLASYHHPDLTKMMLAFPDGIPLEICASMLPFSSKFRGISSLHIHLQAGIKGGNSASGKNKTSFSFDKLTRIISHLISGIEGLSLNKKYSTWNNYYTETILKDNYLEEKENIVSRFIDKTNSKTAIDLGCNTGEFSLLLEKKGKKLVALDIDPLCVESLYLNSRKEKLDITSLVVDLMYPAPAIGWSNAERKSLPDRLHADLVIALALVHHLCIGRNLPFEKLAELCRDMGNFLIIEFVPKQDEKTIQLLAHREDIFPDYDLEHFKKAFERYFDIIDNSIVGKTGRTVFLYKRRG